MAVRWSALRAGHALFQKDLLVLISIKCRIKPLGHGTVVCTCGVCVFIWIITQSRSAISKFAAPHRHFLSAGNVLAVNTHYPAINLALSHFFCSQKSITRTSDLV
jgi:hypothetical protein